MSDAATATATAPRPPANLFPENAPTPLSPPLLPGEGVPWFRIRSDVNADFQFSSLAGRRVVLIFMGSFSAPETAPIFQALMADTSRFGRGDAALILVSIDARDGQMKVPADKPGVRYFFDTTGQVSHLFGAVPKDGPPGAYRPIAYVLDERLRVLSLYPVAGNGELLKQINGLLSILPSIAPARRAAVQAPILIVPNVFEPDFCKRLIAGYEENGGQESGYMKERDGKTVLEVDHSHKRRSDWVIEDEPLMNELRVRVLRRLVPEIKKAYQFHVTRMERYLVACYDSATGGHFNAHRDNTTKGTAHRRFAVSINLNADEYDGGDLVFPEFGQARHKPPTGGACVFSCSLLHEATPVTRGKRYVYLPFVYDDAAAEIRDRNREFIQM